MSTNPFDPAPSTSAVLSGPPAAPVASGSTVEVDLLQQLDDGRPLPRRERVTTPFTYVLMGVFSLVLAFGAGTWTQKHHGAASATTTTNGATGAATFGAAGTGATGTGRTGGFGGAGAAGTEAAGAGPGTGGTAALAGATVGQVKLVDGDNVYVTDQQGDTVKVTLAAGGTVQVTKDGAVSDLKAGETVIVQGQLGADGTVAATSIRSGTTGLAAGGRAAKAAAGATTAPTTTVK
jgi:hypothetical protein